MFGVKMLNTTSKITVIMVPIVDRRMARFTAGFSPSCFLMPLAMYRVMMLNGMNRIENSAIFDSFNIILESSLLAWYSASGVITLTDSTL
jgi:hypothetical protein